MEKIVLPIFNIVVEVYYDDNNHAIGGSITSLLHEPEEDDFNIAMDAIESMILAHAIAGIDIKSYQYLEGIKTAVQSCADNI